MVFALPAVRIDDIDSALSHPRAHPNRLGVMAAEAAIPDQSLTDLVVHLDLAVISVGIMDTDEDIGARSSAGANWMTERNPS
jgi:hypothetical protein